MDKCGVDVGVTSSDFIQYLDVFEFVLTFKQAVVTEEI
jgi:hypothetical protein